MAKGINIGVAADTRAFNMGIKSGVLEPLENVQDALEDVERAGDRATDDLEKGFRDAQRETAELADETKKTSRIIIQESKEAGRALRESMKKASVDSVDSIKEVGRESESVAKETLASFDGSAESIGDAFKDLTVNAGAVFGPAGLIVGGGAALALSAVAGELERQAELTEVLKAKYAELYSGAVAEGRAFIDEAQIIAEAQAIIFDTENPQRYKDIQADALAIGLETSTVLRANAGDQDALNQVVDRTRELYVSASEEYQTTAGLYQQTNTKELTALGRVQERYLGLGKIQAENSQKARDALAVVDESEARQTRATDASVKRYDRTREAMERQKAVLESIPDKTVKVDLDLEAAARDLERFTSRARNLKITANITDPRTGKSLLG